MEINRDINISIIIDDGDPKNKCGGDCTYLERDRIDRMMCGLFNAPLRAVCSARWYRCTACKMLVPYIDSSKRKEILLKVGDLVEYAKWNIELARNMLHNGYGFLYDDNKCEQWGNRGTFQHWVNGNSDQAVILDINDGKVHVIPASRIRLLDVE